MNRIVAATLVVAGLAFNGCAQEEPATETRPVDLAGYDLIDLTHAYGPETVYWPNTPLRFEKTTIFEGAREDGKFYAAFFLSDA